LVFQRPASGCEYILERPAICQATSIITDPSGLFYRFEYLPGVRGNLKSVTRSDGFQLRFNYGASLFPLVSVDAVNNAFDFCDPTSLTCAYSMTWPSAQFALTAGTIAGGVYDYVITGQTGASSKYIHDVVGATPYVSGASRLVGIRAESSGLTTTSAYVYGTLSYCYVDQYSATQCNATRKAVVLRATRGGPEWTYVYTQLIPGPSTPNPDLPAWWNSVVTEPSGAQSSVTNNVRKGILTSLQGSWGKLSYGGDEVNRLLEAIDSEGRKFTFEYDDRGNMLSKSQVASDGSAPLVLRAGYDAVCSNRVTCNKPTWVRDARGNQTIVSHRVV
jgi:YD repeat-containing protein